jgi:hypothetical protein
MIEPKFAFLQMQIEGASRDSIELLEPPFSIAPEALNAVDVMFSTHELVLAMIDSEVLRISNINQAVITTPTVRYRPTTSTALRMARR